MLKKEAAPEPFEFQRRQQLAEETNPGWKAQETSSACVSDSPGEGHRRESTAAAPGAGNGYNFQKLREEHPAAADSPYSAMYPGISGQREERPDGAGWLKKKTFWTRRLRFWTPITISRAEKTAVRWKNQKRRLLQDPPQERTPSQGDR